MDARGGGDQLYELLEGDEGDLGKQFRENEGRKGRFPKVKDEDRRDRTEDEMREEAVWLAREMEKDALSGEAGLPQ